MLSSSALFMADSLPLGLAIRTLKILTLRIELAGATTISIMKISIMTLSIRSLYVILSITDTQHNNTLFHADCHAGYRIWLFVMRSVVMLHVVKLSVIMLSVMAPFSKMLFCKACPKVLGYLLGFFYNWWEHKKTQKFQNIFLPFRLANTR